MAESPGSACVRVSTVGSEVRWVLPREKGSWAAGSPPGLANTNRSPPLAGVVGWGCLGASHPSSSQGRLCSCGRRLSFHITSGFIWVSHTILFYSPGLEIHQCKSFLWFLALFCILLVNVCQVFFPPPLPLWVLCSASGCLGHISQPP